MLNIVFLIDPTMGINVGVKGAYDPLLISGTGAFETDFLSAWVIMPYVGLSATL
ncbi:MAG: hypothetical protein JW904_01380 [Spirochaetales bacterium]|nr:hypothetical protein [Spirochaetales bacterium]